LIVVPEAVLWGIRFRAERLIDDGADALHSPLTTQDDNTDSREARGKLTAAVQAAKLLIAHLDEHFDFVGGFAEPKEEESCRD
jgi:hypothetical protein